MLTKTLTAIFILTSFSAWSAGKIFTCEDVIDDINERFYTTEYKGDYCYNKERADDIMARRVVLTKCVGAISSLTYVRNNILTYCLKNEVTDEFRNCLSK